MCTVGSSWYLSGSNPMCRTPRSIPPPSLQTSVHPHHHRMPAVERYSPYSRSAGYPQQYHQTSPYTGTLIIKLNQT